MSPSKLLTLAAMATHARIAQDATSLPTAGGDARGVAALGVPGAGGIAGLHGQSVPARRRGVDAALAGALDTRGASAMPARTRAPAGPNLLLRGAQQPVAPVKCRKAQPCHRPAPRMMARAAKMMAA